MRNALATFARRVWQIVVGTFAALGFVVFVDIVWSLQQRAGEKYAIVHADDIRVIDGDTVEAHGRVLRLLDIDAPETRRAACDAERAAGEIASLRLQLLLRTAQGGRVGIDPDGRVDRWGRALVRITDDGRDLGAILVAEGLALPWLTGRAAKAERLAHWCGRP